MKHLEQLSVHLISLGCSKNLVDSEVMLGRLQQCRISDDIRTADIIIINTCGFIHAAKQESIQEILRASSERKKGAILVVSGCLSERYASELRAEIPEIDVIIGVRDYANIDTLLMPLLHRQGLFTSRNDIAISTNATSAILRPFNASKHASALTFFPSSHNASASYIPTPNNATLSNTPPSHPSSKNVFLISEHDRRIITGSRLHAYIKLSEGCNQRCAFCAIPNFKGALQSRPITSILREVEHLAKQGFMDFSFIAQDSSSYLSDKGEKHGLLRLIDALDTQNIAKNARIHYLYPASTNLALIKRIIASPIIQNYFDMPLQHASQSVLKRMKRGYTIATMQKLLEAMASAPNAFLRSTFIVGFPGESEEEFEELCAFIQEGIFHRINVFAFSNEEGTAAYHLPNHIPARIINKRLRRLEHIIATCEKRHTQALLGAELHAFIEKTSDISTYLYSARDRRWGLEIDGEILINECYALESSTSAPYGLYRVKITDVNEGLIIGSAINQLAL